MRQHRRVDVREDDEPALPHLLRHPRGEVAGAASQIQRLLPGAQIGEAEGELLPQPVQPTGHEVVHDVVVAGDRVEHAAHATRLVVPGHALVTEVGVARGWIGISHVGSHSRPAKLWRPRYHIRPYSEDS